MKPQLRAIFLTLAAVLLIVCYLGILEGKKVVPQKLRSPLDTLDAQLGGWQAAGKDQTLDKPTLELLKPQSYLLRNYRLQGVGINSLFVAYFGFQTEGQMIHSPKACLPGGGWIIEDRKQIEVPGEGGPWLVNHIIMSKELSKVSALYWYQGRGSIRYSEYWERLSLLFDGVLKKRNDGALVRLTAAMTPGRDVLGEQIEFAAKLIPALDRIFPPPGRARES